MSKALIIGSTVCDIMIYLDRLPSREGDTHIQRQTMGLGGCAFNVAQFLHQMEVDYDFISPVGTGLYGDFVAQALADLGMAVPLRLSGQNGCCYCFVEEDGERTFLSDHGVEYSFDPAWLADLDLSSYDYIYVCGLEVEEETGGDLVEALSGFSGQIIFCPGPRGHLISQERLAKLFQLSPVLHLNEQECMALSGQSDLSSAVLSLFAQTQKTVIVTQGPQGAIAYDGKWYQVPALKTEVKDTIGAGDSHVAGLIAGFQCGFTLPQALAFANRVSSQVVATYGTQLTAEVYHDLRSHLQFPDV